MKHRLAILSFVVFISAGTKAQIDSAFYFRLNDSIRLATDAEFRDPENSPLPPEDISSFSGLRYFPVNMKYVVKADFVRTPHEKPFKMPTTTSRKPEYVKYGEVYFTIGPDSFRLNIYRNLELVKNPVYKNHLFLPFTDSSSGFDTYGGGRYLDLSVPAGDFIILDFNQAYNPYCAYNSGYSCPIPPRENFIPARIEAGVLYDPK